MTTCGVRFEGGVDCEGLQEAESKTLYAYRRFVRDWQGADLCGALNGWSIFLHQRRPEDARCAGGWWLEENCLIGYTHHVTREIEISNTRWDRNAIAHEFAHVFQVEFGELIGHCQWKERGIKSALLWARGFEDRTEDRGCVPLEMLPIRR